MAVTLITIAEVVEAIRADMDVIPSLARVHGPSGFTEGMNTTPTLEVYPELWETSGHSETDRITFCDGDKYSVTVLTVHLDLYARQRSQLNEDWGDAVDLADDIQARLELQCGCPFFGLDGIQSIHWTAARTLFDRAEVLYSGFRFTLEVEIY